MLSLGRPVWYGGWGDGRKRHGDDSIQREEERSEKEKVKEMENKEKGLR